MSHPTTDLRLGKFDDIVADVTELSDGVGTQTTLLVAPDLILGERGERGGREREGEGGRERGRGGRGERGEGEGEGGGGEKSRKEWKGGEETGIKW